MPTQETLQQLSQSSREDGFKGAKDGEDRFSAQSDQRRGEMEGSFFYKRKHCMSK